MPVISLFFTVCADAEGNHAAVLRTQYQFTIFLLIWEDGILRPYGENIFIINGVDWDNPHSMMDRILLRRGRCACRGDTLWMIDRRPEDSPGMAGSWLCPRFPLCLEWTSEARGLGGGRTAGRLVEQQSLKCPAVTGYPWMARLRNGHFSKYLRICHACYETVSEY